MSASNQPPLSIPCLDIRCVIAPSKPPFGSPFRKTAKHSMIRNLYWYIFSALLIPTRTTALASSQVPLVPDQIGTSGCGIPHSHHGSAKDFTLFSPRGGGTREYRLHLPSLYDPNIPTPVVLSFHGFTRNMRSQEQISQLSNDSFSRETIMVYPQGLGVSRKT